MRIFKLRDKVASRMRRGIENTAFETENREEAANSAEKAAEETAARRSPMETLKVISRTDIGLIRKSNQDAVIIGGGIIGVADGMGGHNGGETASTSARDGMIRCTGNQEPSGGKLIEDIRTVNRELYEMQLKEESLSGMGTTLTVLWPTEREMLIGHVGDSRAYLLRNGEFRQMTDDHSLVADMVRRGLLTEEQAACHPMRNYITRAVGTEDSIDPDLLTVVRKPGDRWLICSDGLHGLVSKSILQELLGAENLDESADEMIRQALDEGGRDNVTLVIVEDQIEAAAGKNTEGEDGVPGDNEEEWGSDGTRIFTFAGKGNRNNGADNLNRETENLNRGTENINRETEDSDCKTDNRNERESEKPANGENENSAPLNLEREEVEE